MQRVIMLLVGVLCWVAPGYAQQGAGSGEVPVYLLAQKTVRKDLKLAQKQLDQIETAYAKRKQAVTALKKLDRKDRLKKFREIGQELQKTLQGILDAEQKHRLRQIHWQKRGPGAAGRALKFTLEQQRKVVAAYRSMSKEAAAIRKKHKGNPKAIAVAMRKLRQGVDEQIIKMMTDSQKAQWKKMLGKPLQENPRDDSSDSVAALLAPNWICKIDVSQRFTIPIKHLGA